MNLIRHCIIDTQTNLVINIVEYESEQTGVAPGFEVEQPSWICVASDTGEIGATYADGVITNPIPAPVVIEMRE